MRGDHTSSGVSERGQSRLARLERGERLLLMKFVCSFAWADLQIRPEEREFVARMIQRLGLDAAEARQVEGWLKLPPRPESVDPTRIPIEHRRVFVDAIQGIIEADGEVAVEEQENLDLLQGLLG
jgi:uncharacterized tellurite resistance protein B-like protein